MRRLDWIFVVIIVLSTLSYSSQLQSLLTIFRIIILAVYGVFFLFVVYSDKPVLKQQRFVLYSIGTVWLLYLLHLLIPPTSTELFRRVLVFIVVSVLNIMLIPRVVEPDIFLKAVSRLGAAVVLIGLPAVFLGAYSIGPFQVQTAWAKYQLLPFGPDISVSPLMSYYRNQNFASVTILAGLISSFVEFERGQNRIGYWLVAINAFGLYLCHTRSTMLAAMVGVGIYLTYQLLGSRSVQFGMILGVPLALFAFLMVVLRIGPEPIATIELSGRRKIWSAVIDAIRVRPLFGWGPVAPQPIIKQFIVGFQVKPPHNSYLWTTLQTGIIGGIAYVAFVWLSLLSHLRSMPTSESIVIFSLSSSLALIMLFQNFSLFGLNSSNIITSIALGYAAYDAINVAESKTSTITTSSLYPGGL